MRSVDSHTAFFAGLTAGAATSALIAAWLRRNDLLPLLQGSRPAGGSAKPQGGPTVGPHDLNDVIVQEHLARNIQFFGEQAVQDIASSYIVVVGLGGVGSHAAHHLLRSGVGRLLLIDFDQVRVAHNLPSASGTSAGNVCVSAAKW